MYIAGDYENPVRFNLRAAKHFQAVLKDASAAIDQFDNIRAQAQALAVQGFQGFFAQVFTDNMRVCSIDARAFVEALDKTRQMASYLQEQAEIENARRQAIREYVADHEGFFNEVRDWLCGEDAPPVLRQHHAPAPQRLGDVACGHRMQDTHARGDCRGVSGAVPERLDQAATMLAGAGVYKGKIAALGAAYEDFSSQCCYGRLDVGNLFSQLNKWRDYNNNDVEWLRSVAGAFRAAGGSGSLSRLANSALEEVLSRRGVSLYRQDLTVDSPCLAGIDARSGFIEDPVNTATGNFIEPEVDLSFTGPSAALALTRLYNSTLAATHATGTQPGNVGVFGVGWSSILDQRLIIEEDCLRWVREDGRAIDFPVSPTAASLDGAPVRATGYALWARACPTDQVRDLVTTNDGSSGWVWLVEDNTGDRWVFSTKGVRLAASSDCTRVRVHRDSDDAVTRLSTNWGREIPFDYVDGLVAVAATDDGRRVEYVYNDDARLVKARTATGTRRYEWDKLGLITSVTGTSGVVECVNTYDEKGRVVSQKSPHGRLTRFTYLPGAITVASDEDATRSNTWVSDASGHTIAIIDSDDHRQSMGYDAQGNLRSIRYRDGSHSVFSYDSRSHPTSITLPTGGRLTCEWDEYDRISHVTTAEGATCSYVYPDEVSRNPSCLVGPNGGVTRFTWVGGLLTKVTDPAGIRVEYGYNDHGELVSARNATGVVTRFDRDAAGRIIQVTTPMGHTHSFTYNEAGCLASHTDPEGATWRLEYDSTHRLVAATDPAGALTRVGYDAAGGIASITDPLHRVLGQCCDDLGYPESLRLPDGAQWSFVYDALGRLRQTTDPAGGTWRRRYSANGDLSVLIDPTGVSRHFISKPDQATTFSGSGTRESIIDYDAYARPVKITDAAGGTRIITYDTCGLPIELVDGEGGLTRIERDLAGRVIAIISPAGLRTTYGYDEAGHLAAITSPDGGRTRFSYDADSRLISRTDASGDEATYRYDRCGRLTRACIPGLGRLERAYDACGRLTYSRDLVTGIRHFTYDRAGQLVKTTNGLGGVTRYAYDLRGRVVRVIDPAGGVTTRTYDDLDNITSVTDPLGRVSTATYDAAGRQVSQTGPDGVTISFTYTKDGRLHATHANGRVLSRIERDLVNRTLTIIDHTNPHQPQPVTHTLAFDSLGRLVAQSRDTVSGSGESVCVSSRWGYNLDGARTSYTTRNGDTTTYRYDDHGHLASISHPIVGDASFTYDPAGRVTSVTTREGTRRWEYTNGFVSTYTGPDGERSLIGHDEWGNVTTIHNGEDSYQYRYNDSGSLTRSCTSRGRCVAWEYDTLGRLIRETTSLRGEVSGDRVFTYNRASEITRITQHSAGETGETVFAYDEAGRRTSSVETSGRRCEYTWDTRGCLSGLTVAEDADSSLRVLSTHVDALGYVDHIDDIDLEWDYASILPTLSGIAGHPLVALPGGVVLGAPGSSTSTPWRGAGILRDLDNPYAPQASIGMPAEWGLPAGVGITPNGGLEVAGLSWLGTRLYDPATAGFLSPDPLSAPVGSVWENNPYNYAANNPLSLSDPAGLHPVTDDYLRHYGSTLEHRSIWQRAKDNLWNTNTLISVGLIAAGAFMILTGIGAPAGAPIIAAGVQGLVSQLDTGHVDWLGIGVTTAIGLAAGPVLGFAGESIMKVPIAERIVTGASKKMLTLAPKSLLKAPTLFSRATNVLPKPVKVVATPFYHYIDSTVTDAGSAAVDETLKKLTGRDEGTSYGQAIGDAIWSPEAVAGRLSGMEAEHLPHGHLTAQQAALMTRDFSVTQYHAARDFTHTQYHAAQEKWNSEPVLNFRHEVRDTASTLYEDNKQYCESVGILPPGHH